MLSGTGFVIANPQSTKQYPLYFDFSHLDWLREN
jgi:hypothetical protein